MDLFILEMCMDDLEKVRFFSKGKVKFSKRFIFFREHIIRFRKGLKFLENSWYDLQNS